MKRNPLPPADYLVACFTYDPVTGDMYWKHRPQEHFKNRNAWLGFTTTRAGRLAGQRRFRRNGKPSVVAIPITVDGQSQRIFAHLAIFSLMGVAIPDGLEVDHKDGNPFNNSWSNLRLATRSQNQANSKRHSDRTLLIATKPKNFLGISQDLIDRCL